MSRPRIRTLKPEAWQDERVGKVSRDARLLWVVLLTMADDDGRLRLLPSLILGHGYPYDEIAPNKLNGWLRELQDAGLFIAYEHAGSRYGAFPKWSSHQRINRKTDSTLPAPSVDDHEELSEESRSGHEARTPPRAGGREGKGSTSPLSPPKGGRQRDRLAFDEQVRTAAADIFGAASDPAVRCVKQASSAGHQTHDAIRAFAREWFPELQEVAA